MTTFRTFSFDYWTISIVMTRLLLGNILLTVEVDSILDYLFIEELAGDDELADEAGNISSRCETRKEGSTHRAKVNLWRKCSVSGSGHNTSKA